MTVSYKTQMGKMGKIADEAATSCFDADYQTPENLQTRKLSGLGVRISQYCEWDALQIMEIFEAALTDANFHPEAGAVRNWIQKLESHGYAVSPADKEDAIAE